LYLCNLLSSSSGNATLLSTEKKHYLIDAGVPPAEIDRLLQPLGLSYDRLSGIILTHLHQDHFHPTHIKMLVKFPIKLFIHDSHISPLGKKRKAFARLLQSGRVVVYEESRRFFMEESVSFFPLSVPHDTFQLGKTFGFVFDITSGRERKKLSFFSDLGNMPRHLYEWLKNSDILALEHNYDDDMLWGSTRSQRLKQRIAGEWGHLSNEAANDVIRKCLTLSRISPKNILLLHLSQECNTPDLPRLLLHDTLQEYAVCEETGVYTTKPDRVSDVLSIF